MKHLTYSMAFVITTQPKIAFACRIMKNGETFTRLGIIRNRVEVSSNNSAGPLLVIWTIILTLENDATSHRRLAIGVVSEATSSIT
jgi:hypothetical protein